MKLTARARILITAAWIASLGGPAYAQYVFLDVNGDAACTSADTLTSATSAVDVYLDTNHNADGTVRTCPGRPDQPLDFFSYDIFLRRDGSGTVTFNSYANALPGFVVQDSLVAAWREVGVGFALPAGSVMPPGRYKLGTFDVTVTGTPGLSFVGLASTLVIPSFGTGFGTSCDASLFANTMVLGTDFFDACSTEGRLASRDDPPLLRQPADMTVNTGRTADQILTATDPNGDPLTFSLLSGPEYVTVTTTDPGVGTATGNLHVAAPSFIDSRIATVQVSDGQLEDTRQVRITIAIGPPPPPSACDNMGPTLACVGELSLMEGASLDTDIAAQDVDADSMTFSFAGPSFMTLEPLPQSGTDRLATIHLAPGTGTAGSYAASVTVTSKDGSATQSFTITVTAPSTMTASGALDAAHKVIRLGTHVPSWSVRIQPVRPFSMDRVQPGSVVATFGGRKVYAIDWRSTGDVSFAMSDLRSLFASLPDGRQQVEVVLKGDLTSAASFRAPVRVEVEKGAAFARNYGKAVPNPFNPSTTISFDAASAGRVRLRIFDAHGRLVRVLTDRQVDPGYLELRWDGTGLDGMRVASGIYFYVLETPDGTMRNRLVLAR